MATLAGSDGSFVFCPIPTGTYDIVVVGERSDGTALSAVHRDRRRQRSDHRHGEPARSDRGATGVVQFAGSISSQNSASQGTSIDAQLSALETMAGGTTFTIPLLPNSQQPSATLCAGDSGIVRLHSGHGLRDLCHDAAVRRTVSRRLLGQCDYIGAKPLSRQTTFWTDWRLFRPQVELRIAPRRNKRRSLTCRHRRGARSQPNPSYLLSVNNL